MSKLKDTSASGAVFFAVCRGKVCLCDFVLDLKKKRIFVMLLQISKFRGTI